MKNELKALLLFFCVFMLIPQLEAQLSKTHYIPPLTNAEFGNANPEEQYFYISTPSTKNVSYTITPVGQASSETISGIVSNANPREISLGSGYGQLFIPSTQSSTIQNNKGYIIEAEDVIYVSLRMKAGNSAQAGALVSKGLAALGNTFRVGAFTNENPQNNYLNFVSVMATENNTVIVFDDLPAGLSIKNYTGTLPVSITLHEGESYTLATNSAENDTNKDGLIGTLVTSDKPIVVNAGSANGSFHNGSGRDYGMDQLAGYEKVGKEYIFVKGDGNNNWENVLLVAHEDNTSISINGNSPITNINAGEYYLIEGDQYSANENMYVKTSKNVFAYQGVGANNSEANQGLFFVPPLSCENRGNVNSIANIQQIGATTYTGGITIVTNTDASLTVNSQPINIAPQGVTGNSAYVSYKITGLSGDISIESTGELYCAYYNFDGAATSGSFYSGFPSAPEINLNTAVQTLGTCIPNITLSATNTDVFDVFEWFFNDGSGYVTTGITASSFTPNQPGNYKVVATINCSGLTFESVEIPVSNCPDDYDKDGIIDNKDIDIDNDGVLNCDEGLGDTVLNITDIENPVIVFTDASTNTSIASGALIKNSSSNTFVGQNSGDFISTTTAASASNISYIVNFSQPVNFKFSESEGSTHTPINGAYFILKIPPSTKNITLVDPDNQLLIDTNFDQVFESGVIDFSGSEIHFKYNPTPNGSVPYQFIANQIDQVSFEHHLSNLNENSVFRGNLKLTCFDTDTDNDGILNSFDLDSDNDGIPDIVEKTGAYRTLLSTDTNADGLDDAFDIDTNASDSDADGVFNFLDVDADNDGIFDLEESGNGLADTDADGMLDNPIALVGANGFADTLETSIESGVLNYLITDTDDDNKFNYIALDSDNDACPDVTEAGFTDPDTDGILGTAPYEVDAYGKVTNAADGYTSPNLNYITPVVILLNTPFEDVVFCEATDGSITIDSNADTFQWQMSTDGALWNDITNNTTYQGATTNELRITNILESYNNHQFRVVLGKTGNSCGRTSNAIQITVNPSPTFTPIPVYEQCDIDPNPIDGFTLFNLESKEEELTNNNNIIAVDFFETSDSTFSAPIANKSAYTNTVSTLISNHILNVRLTNTNTGCISYGTIELQVNPSSLSNYSDLYTCEIDLNGNDPDATNSLGSGDAWYNFDAKTEAIIASLGGAFSLTTHTFSYYRSANDAALETNEITAPYDEELFINNSDVFVRIATIGTNACSGVGQFKFFVNALPVPQGNTDTLLLCVNNPIDNPQNKSIDLDADTGVATDTYQWYLNGNLITGATSAIHKANVEGTYYVEAYRAYENDSSDTSDDSSCAGYNTFRVLESNAARIIAAEIIDNLDNPLENKLIVKTTGIGDYTYALNSTNETDFIRGTDNFNITFNNVPPGINYVYVKDNNGCEMRSSNGFSFLFFQRHFTPNNDGVYDTWKILGSDTSFYSSARVEIFDRFGKVVGLITDLNSGGWNGTYNGEKLPSNDYWFNAVLEDIHGNIRKETGHFSLLRK